MADFSALKQSIQNYIKQNGNKDITGNLLQNILLSMVTTMGDGAINDNASDISDIKGDIQNINGDITDINGDITNINGNITDLNGDLSDEVNRAKGAETTTILFSDGKLVFKNAAGTVLYQLSVDSFLNAITTRLNTGALYAGYATPSTTPAALTSQEVFYLATQAGTYTNFHFNGGDDPIVLTKDGIYFIVSGDDDDDWNAEPMLQLDDVPTASSNNPVKSGGVAEELALGAVYDVSAKNPTAGPNNDGKWESLSALLNDANLNTIIPTSVRKGGMSVKFVSSVDNKYVQYFLPKNEWSIDPNDWEKMILEESIRDIQGWTETISSVTTTPSDIQPIANGKTIDSIVGADKLIFENPMGYERAVTQNDLPYTTDTRLVKVKTETGTASNVSIKVRGDIGNATEWLITKELIAKGTKSASTNPQIYAIDTNVCRYDDFSIILHSSATIVFLGMYYVDNGTTKYVPIRDYPPQDTPVNFNLHQYKGFECHIYCQLASSDTLTYSLYQNAPIPQINALTRGYLYMGVANPNGNPTYIDANMFYLAGAGKYTNFGGFTIPENKIGILKYDFKWRLELIDLYEWLFKDTLLSSGTSTGGSSVYQTLYSIDTRNTLYDVYSVVLNSSAQILTLSMNYTDSNNQIHYVTLVEYPEQDTKIQFDLTPYKGNVCNIYCQLASINSVTYDLYRTAPIPKIEKDIKDIKTDEGILANTKFLILGDSYSEGGYWVNGMKAWLPQSISIINLGVTSCSIKDKYEDRATYPYTSRPTSANNSGNLNTLACQIEKLKRLMAGTDLDEGETAIYQNPSDYPDIIILEGGMNDTLDRDYIVDTYYQQFIKKVENVYSKKQSDVTPTLGDAYIKTPIEEVNRTCFAGAYRYVAEELLQLFPNAQIFITTVSGLGYWEYNVTELRYKQAVQQRMCANLMGFSCIDWSAEGQINSIVNFPSGSGTENDPYIWNAQTSQTFDLMHPNEIASKRYGRLAALVIKQRYMEIKTM